MKRFSAYYKKAVAVGGLVLILVCLMGLSTSPVRRVEIRGQVSAEDLAAIKRLHGTECAKRNGVYPAWVPASFRKRFARFISPTEVIAVPKPDQAIIVYRELGYCYTDSQGKRRHWGRLTYTLTKDASGWH